MSVELYRQAVDAWNERDVERFIGCFSPDTKFHSVITGVEGAIYTGHEGLRAYFADLEGTMDDLRADPLEVEVRGEWVIATCRLRGSGTASGVPIDWEIAQLARVSGGVFDFFVTGRTREEALAAAGLE